VLRARDASLDGVVPKVAKRCYYQARTCSTSMATLVIASVSPAAVLVRCVPQLLKESNGHHPGLDSLVGQPYRARLVLGPNWRGVAVEVGVLSVAATGRGPGCHAATMSHTICAGFLCVPLNSRVGSAVEHATVVVAGWVAWRCARNVGKVDTSAEVESRVT
jgi:hypothetical protein